MKWLWFRLALIFVIFIITFYIIFPWWKFNINLPYESPSYKLWLDLNGWVELDYRIDLDEAKKKWWVYNENNIIDWLKSIVEKRVNSLWTAEPTIMTANYGKEAHIIVQIPTSNFEWKNLTTEEITQKNEEYIKKAKDTIGKIVRLEFKEKKVEITDQDKKDRKDIVNKVLKDIKSKEYEFETVANKYKDQYENVEYLYWTWSKTELPAEATFTWMENITTPFISEILNTKKPSSYNIWEDNKIQEVTWDTWFSIIKINSITEQEREKEVKSWSWENTTTTKEKYKEKIYDYQVIFVNEKPSEWTSAKTQDWKVLDEKYLTRASVSMSQWNFMPQVDLTFNDEWAKIFKELTSRLIQKQLAIFVWWQLITAPTVQSVIPDGKAMITGNYTADSAKKLANDINTWIVPAPIYLTSEKTIDAKIWWNSLDIIIFAWIIWFMLILFFLISIYRISGLLAGIALLAYIMMVLTIIKISWIVLTLASIAWLVLSIWLAIDANILIFERTKEELKQKNEILRSLNIGFEKSWTAIWDSHVTSFVSAVILFIFGTNMIKGFWVILWIWIIVSLFSAMWISRILIIAIAPKFTNKLKVFIWLKEDK